MRFRDLTDTSRFQAMLLDRAGTCESLAAFRLQIMQDLRRAAACDGAIFRPGARWTGSHPLYVNEDSRFIDIYVENANRFRPELRRWCSLSDGGREAFIDGDIYDEHQQGRMATYREMLHPERIRSILAFPLGVDGATVGLVFLFRRGAGSRFPRETAAAATRLLSALAVADRFVETAFRHGRPDSHAPRAQSSFESLGPREQQVAALIARGLQTKEIAALLGSSPHTVHVQTRRIFEKLGLHGRTQVALLAQQIGLSRRAATGADPMLGSFAALVSHRLARRFGDHPTPSAPEVGEDPLAALGAREREVAELVRQGLTSREIADRIGTSFHTVRTQTRRIYEKLGVQGRAGLTSLLADRAREG